MANSLIRNALSQVEVAVEVRVDLRRGGDSASGPWRLELFHSILPMSSSLNQ